MSTVACYYNLPSDNLTSSGSPTLATGSAATGYPLTYAYDLRPDKPFHGATTGPHRIVWNWGSARTLGLVALFNVLMDTALGVRFQMHTADAWSSPDVDLAVTIPAMGADGRRPNVWLDLSAQAAKQYASLLVPVNSVAPSIGEIWIGGTLRTIRLLPGVEDPKSHPAIQHGTEHGVSTVYPSGVTRRPSLHGDLILGPTEDAAWDTLWTSAIGATHPFLFILEPAVNDARLIRLDTTKPLTHPGGPYLRRSVFQAEELSPGVPV